MREDPGQGSYNKSLMCYVTQENLEEESDTKVENKVTAEKDALVMAEEKLEEVDLSTDS